VKISVTQGIVSLVEQLRSAIDSEKSRLQKDLESAITKVVLETNTAYRTVFDDIITSLQSSGEIVKSDFKAEATISSFEKDVSSSILRLKDATRSAIASATNATDFIRNGAYEEFEAAITKARSDFDSLKTRFKTSISAISTDVITKTRAGITDITSSAEKDITKLKTVRDTIVSDIEAKFSEVKSDLASVKDAASKDMERIVGFIKTELDKLETRVEAIAAKADRICHTVGIVSLIAAFSASIYLIVNAKQEVRKREELQGNAAREIGASPQSSIAQKAGIPPQENAPQQASVSPRVSTLQQMGTTP
jgi:hypothetical protein